MTDDKAFKNKIYEMRLVCAGVIPAQRVLQVLLFIRAFNKVVLSFQRVQSFICEKHSKRIRQKLDTIWIHRKQTVVSMHFKS